MSYEANEFDRMRYRVYGNTSPKIVLEFPDMAAFKDIFYATDLPADIDPDELFRFLCYMYDPMSPCQSILDLRKRKAQAMLLINKEPPYTEAYDKALRWQIQSVNRRAIVFMMVCSSEKYALWRYNQEKLFRIMETEINLEGADEKSTQAAITAEKTKNDIMKSLTLQIEEAKRDFLQGETNRELEGELVRFSLQDTLGIRPEEYITNFEQSGKPFS